ncbi:hypothetical protein [Spirosoma rigui]|uniref:hypothetical protein n=1 Tax=Spirosoma rigui TaxID=564064 RepID=UPI0012D2DC38|nr:hypothetical protein [Spirosoma rigui]
MLLFLLYFVGETYSIWLALLRQNNLFVLNFYPIGGIALIGYMYALNFDSRALKRLLLYSAGLFSCLCIALFEWNSVSSPALFVYKTYIIFVVLLHFNKIISDLRVRNILVHTLFWVNAGLIMYASGTMFISLFSDTIFNPAIVDDDTFDKYWNINNILFIILTILTSIGIWFSKYDRENLL